MLGEQHGWHALEWLLQRDHLVHENCERVDVARLGVDAIEDLRRHVAQSPQVSRRLHRPALFAVVLNHLREPKVADSREEELVDEDVVRLEVAVEDVLRVEVLHARRDSVDVDEPLCVVPLMARESVSLGDNDITERASRDVLGDDCRPVLAVEVIRAVADKLQDDGRAEHREDVHFPRQICDLDVAEVEEVIEVHFCSKDFPAALLDDPADAPKRTVANLLLPLKAAQVDWRTIHCELLHLLFFVKAEVDPSEVLEHVFILTVARRWLACHSYHDHRIQHAAVVLILLLVDAKLAEPPFPLPEHVNNLRESRPPLGLLRPARGHQVAQKLRDVVADRRPLAARDGVEDLDLVPAPERDLRREQHVQQDCERVDVASLRPRAALDHLRRHEERRAGRARVFRAV